MPGVDVSVKMTDDGTMVAAVAPSRNPKCPKCGYVFAGHDLVALHPGWAVELSEIPIVDGEPCLFIIAELICPDCRYTMHVDEPVAWWGETKEGRREVLRESDFIPTAAEQAAAEATERYQTTKLVVS